MKAGTGVGVGIALALVVVFIAGPGAYYYRKRKRRQIEEARSTQVLEAGEDYYGGVKPQLDDTAVSPETAWRISRSTIDDTPIPVSEMGGTRPGAVQTEVSGLQIQHPSALGPGRKEPKIQELDVSLDGRRPELPSDVTTPPPAEMRVDKSPPVEAITENNIQPLAAHPVESREEATRSDDSIPLPVLPGPLLPPKGS